MIILYITNYNKIQLYGGYINDYMNDLLFHGLTQLPEVTVVDSTPIIHLYKSNKNHINPNLLWGKGFTTTYLLDNETADRENLIDKIQNQYYDLIVYGNIRRCNDYYDLVSKCYSNEKVICIDGNDDTNCLVEYYNKHLYYKRELILNHSNLRPINFAIPECKITNNFEEKENDFASIIPGTPYSFDTEYKYYMEYNKLYYGVTMKKAGWDCLRHYEILANHCVPFFRDLKECPPLTLTNLPKNILMDAHALSYNFDINQYNDILEYLFEYTKRELTTKRLAQKFLEDVYK